MNATQQLVQPKQLSRLRLTSSLLRKEFKEIGHLTGVILILGLATVFLGAALVPRGAYFFREIAPMLTGLAKALPVMVLLAGGSALFAIERENRSYVFLRSLPLKPSTIFWAKITVLVFMAFLTCLLAWPMAFLIQGFSERKFDKTMASLPAYLVSMGEILLWSVYFSLRENKVIRAIVKSIVGFVVVTNGITVISLIDISNPKMDFFFYWTCWVVRLGAAICLTILIRKELSHWFRDRATKHSLNVARSAIKHASAGPRSFWFRLVWLQFRAHWVVISVFGFASFALIFATTPSTVRSADMLVPTWSISIAFMGALAAYRPKTEWRFLISNGYNPRTVWWVSSASLFFLCLVSSLFFWLWTPLLPEHYNALAFHLQNLAVAFAMGQLATLFCRTLIPSLMLTTLFATIGYFFLSMSRSGLENQIPTIVLLCGVSIALVFYLLPKIATRGKLEKKFWIAAPLLYGLALVPLPLLRVYEVPYADVDAILTKRPQTDSDPSPDFATAQQIGDELIKLRDTIRSSSQPEGLSQIRHRFLDTVNPLLGLDVDQLDFLHGSKSDIRDVERFDVIRSACASAWTTIEEQARNGYVDHAETNRLILSAPKWSVALHDSPLLYWWASHPETQAEDIRVLIRWLENEQQIFEIYRAGCLASYRYLLAALETNPDVFPRIHDGPYLSRHWVTKIPWEVARFKRDIRHLLVQEWTAIEKLESLHQKQEFDYSARYLVPKHHENLIAQQIEYFRTTNYWSMETSLFASRATRLYLAIILWQREHDKAPPESLDLLVGDYLTKIPVSPFDGEKFCWASNGFTVDQLKTYPHMKDLHRLWQSRKRHPTNSIDTVEGHPILWINLPPFENSRNRSPWIKVHLVDQFNEPNTQSNVTFWILPHPTRSLPPFPWYR